MGKVDVAAKGKRKPAGRAPISSHPAFPAIVALWFAALFGIGSMVLPVILLEKLVTATGIASLVPAAAPPLGMTARILIALSAAGLGVVLGIVLSRRVAAAQVGQAALRRAPRLHAADAHPDAPVKWPISARDELGSEKLDDPFEDDPLDDMGHPADAQFAELMPDRRHALAVTGDDEDVLELDHVEPAEEAPVVRDGAMPLLEDVQCDATDEALCEPGSNVATEPLPCDEEELGAPVEAEPETRPFAMPEAATLEPETCAQAPHPSAASIDRPLAELSIAQLVDRFALALHAKAAEAPAHADRAEEAEPLPWAEPTQPYVDADENRDFSVAEARRPLDLGEFADYEDETGGEGFSSLLNMRRPRPAGREFARIEDADDNGDARMNGAEALAVFPGQLAGHARPSNAPSAGESGSGNAGIAPAAPANPPLNRADPNETEKALREALEKLQRMSGAA
jgi:hypothetical protein